MRLVVMGWRMILFFWGASLSKSTPRHLNFVDLSQVLGLEIRPEPIREIFR